MAHVGAHMRDATQDGPWAFLHFSPLTFASYAVLLGAVAALLVLSSPSFYDFVGTTLAILVVHRAAFREAIA